MKAYAIAENGQFNPDIVRGVDTCQKLQQKYVDNLNEYHETDRYSVIEVEVRADDERIIDERDRVVRSLVFALALTLILVIMVLT